MALAYLSEALEPPRRAGAIGAMSTSFLVAGIVPGLCTLFMKWNDGDPLYVCLFTLLAGATSAASAFIVQKKHNAAVRRSPDGEVEHV